MARKKSTIKTIVEKVEEVIQTVSAEVGLVLEDPKPKSKSARKAARKAAVEKTKEAEKTRRAKRIARVRAMA